MAKRNDESMRYAAIGADARIKELQSEIDRIRTAFPGESGGAAKSSSGDPRRKKRKLSAAGRKAISDAAKARWARVKAGKKR